MRNSKTGGRREGSVGFFSSSQWQAELQHRKPSIISGGSRIWQFCACLKKKSSESHNAKKRKKKSTNCGNTTNRDLKTGDGGWTAAVCFLSFMDFCDIEKPKINACKGSFWALSWLKRNRIIKKRHQIETKEMVLPSPRNSINLFNLLVWQLQGGFGGFA